MKTRKKERRWHRVTRRKEEALALQIADSLRALSPYGRSREHVIRIAALMVGDNELERRLRNES